MVATARDELALSFTAPGDDGTVGTAERYDVRLSARAFEPAGFESAPAAGVEVAPLPAGSSVRFTLRALLAGATYWIAIRAVDEAANRGDVTTVLSATTLPPRDVFSEDRGNVSTQQRSENVTLPGGDVVPAINHRLVVFFSDAATNDEVTAAVEELEGQGARITALEADLRMVQVSVEPAEMTALLEQVQDAPGVVFASPELLFALEEAGSAERYWKEATHAPSSDICDTFPIAVVDGGDHGKHVEAIARDAAGSAARIVTAGGGGPDWARLALAAARGDIAGFLMARGINEALRELGSDRPVIQMSMGTPIERQTDGSLLHRFLPAWPVTEERAASLQTHYRAYLTKVAERARSHDAILVISAGNDGVRDDRYLPPGSKLSSEAWEKNVIRVGGVHVQPGQDGVYGTADDRFTRPPWSAYGKTVDLYAPGVQITAAGSPYPQGANGTSFAAPQASAAAARLRCENPGLTAEEVKRVLLDTADVVLLQDGSEARVLNVTRAVLRARGLAGIPLPVGFTGELIVSSNYADTDGVFGTHTLSASATLPFSVTVDVRPNQLGNYTSGSNRTAWAKQSYSGQYSVQPTNEGCGVAAGSGSVSGSIDYYVDVNR